MKIKFRVWDKNRNRYEPKYLFAIDEVGDLWRIDSTDAIDFTSERDRYIIEQFTGLYDKNGKEIYEGDIVEEIRGKGIEVRHATDEEVGSCGCCFPKFIGAGFIISSNCHPSANELEVVGNIHESKDLM